MAPEVEIDLPGDPPDDDGSDPSDLVADLADSRLFAVAPTPSGRRQRRPARAFAISLLVHAAALILVITTTDVVIRVPRGASGGSTDEQAVSGLSSRRSFGRQARPPLRLQTPPEPGRVGAGVSDDFPLPAPAKSPSSEAETFSASVPPDRGDSTEFSAQGMSIDRPPVPAVSSCPYPLLRPRAHSLVPAGLVMGRSGDPNGTDGRGLPTPLYPPESERLGEQALVELDVEILTDGSVGMVTVVSDGGYWRLSEAATTAVRRAKFDPARWDGVPFVSTVRIPFRFVLKS